MPRVSVYVASRFLNLVEKLAAESYESRSSLLSQVVIFGLRDYAELYLLTARLTREPFG
jgi:metal-responsive CopG/Arc/MetJ family transcriptional regulator